MILETLIFSKHLEEGEEILYVVRKHWVSIFRPVFLIGLFGYLLPWGLYFMGFRTPVFFWVAVIWSLLAFFRFLDIYNTWYANAWLVTNMSIIQIEWSGPFRNLSGRTGFEDVVGVTYQVSGFWGTVLGYGDITLKINSGNNLEMRMAANPKKVELSLAHFQGQYLHQKEAQQADHLKGLLSEMVGHYLRQK